MELKQLSPHNSIKKNWKLILMLNLELKFANSCLLIAGVFTTISKVLRVSVVPNQLLYVLYCTPIAYCRVTHQDINVLYLLVRFIHRTKLYNQV